VFVTVAVINNISQEIEYQSCKKTEKEICKSNLIISVIIFKMPVFGSTKPHKKGFG